MNQLAIQTVQKYIENHLFEPEKTWPNDIFERRVYSRWAALEILQRLMDNPFDFPDVVIEGFYLEMDVRACMETDERRHKLFAIGRDTAQDILCLFT